MAHKAPIFIYGIMKRSGTNYLQDLLCLHPDCAAGSVSENFFLEAAELLEDYTEITEENMIVECTPEEKRGVRRRLCGSIGTGLTRFLYDGMPPHPGRDVRLVSKTPSVRNIEKHRKFFPGTRFVLIVRDGRQVVESYARSYGWTNYEYLIRRWNDGACTVIDLMRQDARHAGDHIIVKYEELYTDTERGMRRVLDFLGLDSTIYDFERAACLPVRGSSVFRGEKKELHWAPVERTTAFDPLDRAAGWGRKMHERFNWLAGGSMRALGYAERKYEGKRVLWRLWNLVMDIVWVLRKAAKRMLK